MRFACLIDSLGSGGAERQLSELAVGLTDSGHEVALCYYHGHDSVNDFYEARLRQAHVAVLKIGADRRFERVRLVRAWLDRFQPDLLQSYLPGPNAIAVLTGLRGRTWRVVVSERINFDYRGMRNFRMKAIAQLYRGADWIVTNSESTSDALAGFIPAYRKKTSVIWNSVDLERFRPRVTPESPESFRFLCVASMGSRKNSLRLVEALALLKRRCGKPFVLRWVGRYNDRIPDHRINMAATRQLIERFRLGKEFILAGEVENVESEYRTADALVLVSTREGLPNAICEGMASGLPIVAGAVADIPRIVSEGENGFLCDPFDPQDIARALESCLKLGPHEKARLGTNSRRTAEILFSRNTFIGRYESLYEMLCTSRRGRRSERDGS